MADYAKHEGRAWAREYLTGCSAVTIPTFTADLKQLNEDAIRHDIERAVEHGFSYTLLMTETAITPEEAGRFTAVARETAAGRLRLFAHAAFGTLDDNIEALSARAPT
jgi:4-hydroxy-tetrahydrodipicolinate synthase